MAVACENETEIRYIENTIMVPSGIPIETAAQLASIGIDPDYPADGEYYLVNNINLADLEGRAEFGDLVHVWRPIGGTCRECGGPLLSANKASVSGSEVQLPLRCENDECSLSDVTQDPFSGILHGDGKTISGLVLSGGTEGDGYTGAASLGLFGYIYGAYIHDLTLKVANTAATRVAYTGTDNANPNIGALAGYAASSTIEHISLETDGAGSGLYATSVLKGGVTYNYIGGLVGQGLNTAVRNITSSLPVDVDGSTTTLYVGGIAGNMGSAGTVDEAHVATGGNITVNGTDRYLYVAGITPTAKTITYSTVTIDTLSLNEGSTTAASSGTLSGIGNAAVTDCTVDIAHIRAVSTHTSGSYPFYVGGIAAASSVSNSIERCTVRFEDMTVEAESGPITNVSIGGIVSSMPNNNATPKVIGCTVEGGTITVNFPVSSAAFLSVGGLAGQGNIENSSVSALEIDITCAGTGQINAGGLTGRGVARHSFIGTKANPARVTVTKTDATLGSNQNAVYLGGISGDATLSAATGPFQYNYAFCDVTLITAGASTTPNLGQRVGGLVGMVSYSGTGPFTENYAAGTVTLTNNYAGSEDTPVIYASGIASFFDYANTGFTVSKCAALGSVVIDGTNTSATKNWRRIVNTQGNTTLANNITTIADTVPADHSLDSGLDKKDGLYVENFDEDTFFGTGENQLGWDKDVWKWDAAIGYPVFK